MVIAEITFTLQIEAASYCFPVHWMVNIEWFFLLAVLNSFMAEFDFKVSCFAVYDAFYPEIYAH